MNIAFSKHADLKIAQRKLSRQKIFETVARPDRVLQSRGGREILLKKFKKNNLQVIIKRENTTVIIVTAHWVARASKA